MYFHIPNPHIYVQTFAQVPTYYSLLFDHGEEARETGAQIAKEAKG